MTYVQTGDINSMWLRDSSVQVAIYIPYMVKNAAIRMLLEGAIRKLAHGALMTLITLIARITLINRIILITLITLINY